jgi:hypothetical protein
MKKKQAKRFKVIYVPFGKEDKEWIHVTAQSVEQLHKMLKNDVVVSIVEEPFED